MWSLVISVLVGGGLGAALGYCGQCSSGQCPLTSTWWRGALYGGVLGVLFHLSSAGGLSAAPSAASGRLPHVGEADFEAEVTRSALPVLVDFYAPWCGPCKMMAPRLDKLAAEYEGRVKVVKVNVDDAPRLAERFEIRGVPTLLLFKGGKPVDTMVGLVAPAALKARLDSWAGPRTGAAAPAG